MDLKTLKTKSEKIEEKDAKLFDQNMNLKNLKSLQIERQAPEVKLLDVK